MLPQCWIRVAKERGIIRRYRRDFSAEELGRIEDAVREFGLACLPVREEEDCAGLTPADWLAEKRAGMWSLSEIVAAAAVRELESADEGVGAKMAGVRIAAANFVAAKKEMTEQQRRVALAGEMLAVAAAGALDFLPLHLLKAARRQGDAVIAEDDEAGRRVAKAGQPPKTKRNAAK